MISQLQILFLKQFQQLLEVNDLLSDLSKYQFSRIILQCMILIFTDCSCANNLELSSTCLGGTIQNNAMGDYAKVCVGDNNTQVYQHSSNNVYLYYVANLEVH